jgi:cardiolipin synthase (CMP-forming)
VIRQLPNFITILRFLVSPVLAALLCYQRFYAALGLVVFAGITDWLDGYAARKLNVSGKTGVLLDPLADKALLVTLFLALGYIGLIPRWLLALVIGRDLVIVIGSVLLRIFRNVQRFVPSVVGKVSTFFQIVFVLLVLLSATFSHPIFTWLKDTALVLTTVFTALSGVGYVRKGIQLTRRKVEPSAL